MAAAAGTFFDQQQFGVKIIGERNHEEEQYHGADKRGPFAPSRVATNATLLRPPGAPEDHSGDGDEEPENIEH
jgi:hypothetical protein